MWIGVGGAVLVVILLIVAGLSNKNTVSNVTGELTSWKRGPDTATVKMVEYADFQCPACAQYHPLVLELEKAYPNELQVQFRHFPLTQIHIHALNASRAAEAAGRQGKFWEMHDMIFEKQTAWSGLTDPRPAFESYAKDLGLNVEQFKADSENKDLVDGGINADRAEGEKMGVNGTPTFYVNGKKVDANPRSLDEFKALIESSK